MPRALIHTTVDLAQAPRDWTITSYVAAPGVYAAFVGHGLPAAIRYELLTCCAGLPLVPTEERTAHPDVLYVGFNSRPNWYHAVPRHRLDKINRMLTRRAHELGLATNPVRLRIADELNQIQLANF